MLNFKCASVYFWPKAMMIASLALSNISVGPKIEACFQNFAAGLILAAGLQKNKFCYSLFMP
jgi:hypothetical protein